MRAGATTLCDALVWGVDPPRKIHAIIGGRSVTFAPTRLILATGAFERPLPFPGWTLPGVMTTGAAQTLLRAHGVIPGQRVVIAGNGPLNFQVAHELMRSGVDVIAVVESAALFGARNICRLAQAALHAPRQVSKGLA